jgi:dUTPase
MSTPEGENPDLIVESLPDPTPPPPPQEEEGTETPDIPYEFVSPLIRYKRTSSAPADLPKPVRPSGKPFNIGYHFCPNITSPITILPGKIEKIPLGIDIAIPPCHYGRFIMLNPDGTYSHTTSVLGSILQPQSRSPDGVIVYVVNLNVDEALVIQPKIPIVELIVESVNMNNILEIEDDNGTLGTLPTNVENSD